MAKHKPFRRRKFNMRKVRLAASVGVGALDAADVTSGAITAVTTDPLRIVSAHLSWQWTGLQAVADDGLEFGLAHSDYTAAEIEECLESQASMDLGDKVAQEQGNRLVRSIGTISTAGLIQFGGSQPFNQGRKQKTKLNWKLSTGDSLNVWIRNGSAVIWTTGSNIEAIGEFYVVDS